MLESAEFEDAVAAWRLEIKALCAEVRRLEGQRDRLVESAIAIPVGWLPTVAQGLEDQISGRLNGDRRSDADHLGDAERETHDAEREATLEGLRSLARAVRDVEPGSGYSVDGCDHEALLVGVAAALYAQRIQLMKMPVEHTYPRVLRFVAEETYNATAALYSLLVKRHRSS